MLYDADLKNSLLLAGTVALPSPFPAPARVSVGVYAQEPGCDPDVYLEIVQVVDMHRTIVRIVRFEDVRAIQASDGTTPVEEAPLQSARQLSTKVDAISRALVGGANGSGKPVEKLLFKEAIVYVPEAAPVVHRAELGLTAIESAEDHGLMVAQCCSPGSTKKSKAP